MAPWAATFGPLTGGSFPLSIRPLGGVCCMHPNIWYCSMLQGLDPTGLCAAHLGLCTFHQSMGSCGVCNHLGCLVNKHNLHDKLSKNTTALGVAAARLALAILHSAWVACELHTTHFCFMPGVHAPPWGAHSPILLTAQFAFCLACAHLLRVHTAQFYLVSGVVAFHSKYTLKCPHRPIFQVNRYTHIQYLFVTCALCMAQHTCACNAHSPILPCILFSHFVQGWQAFYGNKDECIVIKSLLRRHPFYREHGPAVVQNLHEWKQALVSKCMATCGWAWLLDLGATHHSQWLIRSWGDNTCLNGQLALQGLAVVNKLDLPTMKSTNWTHSQQKQQDVAHPVSTELVFGLEGVLMTCRMSSSICAHCVAIVDVPSRWAVHIGLVPHQVLTNLLC